MKRVFAGGDTHCGSKVGLTPPGWWYSLTGNQKQIGRQQRELWDFYSKQVDALKPFDVAIFNGDLIDGTGSRSGGTELITTDRLEQVAMAAHVVKHVGAEKVVMTYGTPYHAGTDEDIEEIIAEELPEAEIHGHAFIGVHGWVFDVKHKVGSSTVPHGRHTAMAREHLWNVLWSEADGALKSDIILRSHVHYHNFCGGPDWLGMTLPALQGLGSKYGVRQCSGVVDFGFVTFEVTQESYSWNSRLLRIKSARPSVIKV